ncbi:MAG: hypothetical protein ACLQNE_47020 [Thermoguttaceae bacterium]|jgi:hypothetical protein
MDKAPLVMDEIDSGEAFIKRLHDYAPVKAAWWLRSADDGERYLYVAIDGLDESNADLVYGEVLRITGEMKDHYIDPFRVKVVSTKDAVAKAIMDIYRRFPTRIPPRFDGRVLGGVAIAEVYIYPQLPARS